MGSTIKLLLKEANELAIILQQEQEGKAYEVKGYMLRLWEQHKSNPMYANIGLIMDSDLDCLHKGYAAYGYLVITANQLNS